jgi:protein-disulfide isomerase
MTTTVSLPRSARAVRRLAFVLFLLTTAVLAACGAPPPKEATRDLKIAPVGSGAAPVDGPRLGAGDPSQAEGPLPVLPDDAVRGERDALVTIVLFTDFQCPFCARLAPTLDELRSAYAAGELRIVLKNNPLPFHDKAKLAAEIGQAVLETRGQEAFWAYHDMIFRRQRELLSEEGLRRAAQSLGLVEADLEAGLARHAWTKKVERDMELARAVGAMGTPAMFVNGVSLSGAQPLEKIKTLVDAQLAEGRALAKSGVARGKIYKTATVTNFKAPKLGHDAADDDDDDKPDATVWKVPVGTSPVRGKATALVTLVTFSDFQCPYCKRVEPTLASLQKTYGDKLRIVWKDEPLPFHPRAKPAANLARAARAQKGDAAFWDLHDRLFDAQPKLDDDDLKEVARAAGLDVTKAMNAVTKNTYGAAIDSDMDLADDVQASGTPHFFINGRRLVGAQPPEKFKTLIDEEMAKAQALVAKGTAPSAVYDELTKNGKAAVEPEKKSASLPKGAAATRGPAGAAVTIQMFSDFQCPFCRRVNPTVDEILKAYPTQVKVVWRDKPLPMHPNAMIAAEAARDAFAQKGNDGFWKMHARLFADSQKLERADLDDHARALGLDMTKFAAALDGHTHRAAIDADDKAGTDAGITGTPAFLVGPYYVSGAQPFSKFRRVIDKALGLPPGQSAALAVAPAREPKETAPIPTPPKSPAITVPAPLAAGIAKDDAKGAGPAVKAGDKVTVHYTGKLTDGKVFDSSRTHGSPFTFTVGAGQVIKGWERGLVGMQVSGKRTLTLPPDLAYGSRGSPPVIPPDATLVFEIELLKIE